MVMTELLTAETDTDLWVRNMAAQRTQTPEQVDHAAFVRDLLDPTPAERLEAHSA